MNKILDHLHADQNDNEDRHSQIPIRRESDQV